MSATAFHTDDDALSAPGDLWVFGYGSLMWKPGFPFTERLPGRLVGEHRALCIFSFVHRGTPERPGLVLGLDRGGACRGIAFRVKAADRVPTVHYLREREQVTGVYREVHRTVWLHGDPRERVSALCYVANRAHPQYAGRLTVEEQVRLIRQGHGQSGPNADYVVSTVREMQQQGVRDPQLHRVAAELTSVPR